MRTTLICLWLPNSLVHMISGCFLYAPEHVTGYTGDSVVLPCYCTGGQAVRRKEMTESTDVRQVDSSKSSLSQLKMTNTSLPQLKIHAVFFLILDPTPSLATLDSQFSCPVPVLISRGNLNM
ncbi:hypothetical protein GJAV_G00093030 [Gymnothorax javanicus]|nr:hypothetical protein GJAV_G00093030 [Gymnothorax javanicus]